MSESLPSVIVLFEMRSFTDSGTVSFRSRVRLLWLDRGWNRGHFHDSEGMGEFAHVCGIEVCC